MADITDLFSVQRALSQQGAPAPQQSFSDLYNQVAAASQQMEMQQASPQLNGWYQNNPSAAPVRQLNPLEQGLMGASDVGENLMSITGFDPSKGFTPENIGRFALGLPFQLVGAPLTGLAQGYEGVTGQNIIDRPEDQPGMAYDYTLDPTQRAAQIGNFVINDIGVFAGGSGRILGNIGRAAGLGNMADRIALGRIGQAYRNAPAIQRHALGIAGDVAEEAGEEFGQSFMDDARWNQLNEDSLGRAAEGAAWGALGGGMFSVAGRGLGHVLNKENNPAAVNAPAASPTSDVVDGSVYSPYTESGLAEGHARASATAARFWGEEESGRSVSERPGSTNRKVTLGLRGIGRDNMIFGTRPFEAMWRRSNADRQVILSRFGAENEDAIEEALSPDKTEQQKADALNAILATRSRNGVFKLAFGRNPQTKNGMFYLNLSGFAAGDFLGIDEITAQIFGGDIDGDTASNFFDLNGVSDRLAYPSMMAVDPEGRTNVDWEFTALSSSRTFDPNEKAPWDQKEELNWDTLAREFVRRCLTNLNTGKQHELARELADALKLGRDDTITPEGSDVPIKRNAAISRALTRIWTTMSEGLSKGVPDNWSDGEKRRYATFQENQNLGISEFVRQQYNGHFENLFEADTQGFDMHAVLSNYAGKLQKDFEDNIKSAINEGYLEKEKADAVLEYLGLNQIWSAGSKGDISTIIQAYRNFGFVLWHSPEYAGAHPTFRQYSEYGYTQVKSIPVFVKQMSSVVEQHGFDDIFKQMALASYGVTGDGETPRTAIEGMADEYVMSNAMREAGINLESGVQDLEGLSTLTDKIMEWWNKSTDVFNSAIRELHVGGWISPFDAKKRNQIGSREDPNYAETMFRFLQKWPVDKVFPNWKDSAYLYGQNGDVPTLGSVVAHYAKNRDFEPQVPGLSDTESLLLHRMIGSAAREPKAIRSRFLSAISDTEKKGRFEKVFTEGKIETAEDIEVTMSLMDVINEFCGWKTTRLFKLFDPVRWAKTRIGEKFFKGDTDIRASILVGLNYLGKFYRIAEWYAATDEQRAESSYDQEKINDELDDLARIDAVHARIADEFKRTGGSVTLEMLVDIDASFSHKEREFQDLFGDDITLDIVDSSLKRPGTDEMISSSSQTIVAVESAASRYVKRLREDDWNDFQALQSHLDTTGTRFGDQRISNFIMSRDGFGSMYIDNTILGAMVYDSMFVFNADQEKATIGLVYQGAYPFLDFGMNGGPTSVLTDLTSSLFDTLTIDEFAGMRGLIVKMFVNGNYQITIQDPVSGEEITLNREKVFKYYCGDDISIPANQMPTDNQWMALFSKVPQLMGVFAADAVRSVETANGVSSAPAKNFTFTNGLSGYENTMQRDENDPRGGALSAAMDFNINWIGNKLLCENEWLPFIVRCVRGSYSEEAWNDLITSPKRLSEEVYRMHLRCTRYVHAVLQSGTPAIDLKREAIDPDFQEKMEQALDAWSVVISKYMEEANHQFSNDLKDYLPNIAKAEISDLKESLFVDAVVEELIAKDSEIGKKMSEGWVTKVKDASPASIVSDQLRDDLTNSARSITGELQEISEDLSSLQFLLAADAFSPAGVFGFSPEISNSDVDKIKTEVKKHVADQSDQVTFSLIDSVFAECSTDSSVRILAKIDKKLSDAFEKLRLKNKDTSVLGYAISLFRKYQGNAIITWDQVEDELKKIGEFTGDNALITLDETDNRYVTIKDQYDKARTPEEKSRVALFHIKSMLYQRIASDISRRIGEPVNGNFLGSMKADLDMLHRVVDEYPSELITEGGSSFFGNGFRFRQLPSSLNDEYIKKPIADFKTIVPDYTDPSVETLCAKLLTSQKAGGNPFKVSINGGEMKHLQGLAWLDRAQEDAFISQPISASDLLDLKDADVPGVDRTYVRLEPDGELMTVQSARGKLMGLKDTKVEWYNPLFNPHGYYSLQSPQSYNPNYKYEHRLSSILLRIIQASQEQLVLKVKKKYDSGARFVSLKLKTDIRKSTDVATGRKELVDSYLGFLEEFAKIMVGDEFKDTWCKEFGYTKEQAIILAQGLTTGFKVEILDQNGNHTGQYAHFDISDVLDPDRYVEMLTRKALPDGYSYGNAQIYCLTPRTLAYRATRVANDFMRENKMGDPTEAVKKALTNYDDFKYESLDIGRIFSRVPSVGWNRTDTLSLGIAPTGVMRLLELTSGIENPLLGETHRGMHGRVEIVSMDPSGNTETGKRLLGHYQELQRIVKTSKPKTPVNNVITGTIISVFADDMAGANVPGDVRKGFEILEKKSTLDTVNPSSPYKLNSDENQFTLCLDAGKLSRAIDFAQSSGTYFVVAPKSIVPEDIPLESAYFSADVLLPYSIGTDNDNYRISNDNLVIIDTRSHGVRRSPFRRQQQSPISNVTTREILTAMSAPPNIDIPIAQLGDASGIIRASKAHLISSYVNDNFKADVSTFFKDKDGASYSIVTSVSEDSIQSILDAVDEKDLKARYQGQTINIDEIKEKMRIHLEKIAGSKGVNVLMDGVSRGDCVAVVRMERNGEEHFAPVLLPDTAPKSNDQVRVILNGSNLACFYSGVFYMADPTAWGWTKGAPERESMKVELVPMPDEYFDQNMLDGIDVLWSNETESGRTGGKDEGIVLGSLYYDIKQNGSHLLWNKTGPDSFELKPWVKDLVDKGMIDLFVTMRDVHDNSITGDKNLFTMMLTSKPEGCDLSDKQLLVIRSVIRMARKFGLNPYEVLGATVLPDVVKDPDSKMVTGVAVNQAGNITGFRSPTFEHGHFDLAYGPMDSADMRLLFSAIDPSFCAQTISDNDDSYRYDNNWMRNVAGKRQIARTTRMHFMADSAQIEGEGGRARYSRQAFNTQGIEHGYASKEYVDAMRYGDFIIGRPDFLDINKRFIDDEQRMISLDPIASRSLSFDEEAEFYQTYAEYKAQREMREEYSKTRRKARHIEVRSKDGVIENILENERLRDKVDAVAKAAGCRIDIATLNELVCMQYGWTSGNGEYDFLWDSTYATMLEQIAENWTKYGIPVVNNNGRSINDRIAMPLLPPEIASWIWKNSGQTKKFFDGNRPKFEDAMQTQMKIAEGLVGKIKNDQAKKRAYQRYGTMVSRQWGLNSDGWFGYVADGMWVDDIITGDNIIGSLVRKDPRWNVEAYEALKERAEEQHEEIVDRLHRKGEELRVVTSTEYGGGTEVYLQQDLRSIQGVLNGMAETSKVLAMWNPGVVISNFGDRTIGAKILEFALGIGRNGYGPYKTDVALDQDIVARAANDPLLQKIYIGLRCAAISGNELEALANMTDIHAMNAYLDQRFEQAGWAGKIAQKTFELASGGNWMIRTQLANFINRFPMFAATVPGLEFWQMEVPGQRIGEGDSARSMTLLESELMANPAKWFIDILGGDRNRSASMGAAMQALNSAKKCDMAQRHVLGEIIGEFCRRTTLGKFLFTTCISRFPNYALNVTHRVLNYILPMSSIYYVFTSNAADIEAEIAKRTGRSSLHLEDTQVHTSLKEAFLVDLTKLGTTAVLSILVGVSGLLQPPDDDDKWGNQDEWLIGGSRIAESWWMQDILGIALPCAIYVKSAMLGRTNTNILFNGIANCCYSNPVIKVSDAIGFALDPEGSFFSDYKLAQERYADAPGGAPGFMDYISANAASFGLSWTTQFFTPSIAREFYNNMQTYEHSYNRVYATSPSGKLTEGGTFGDTEKTSYADAMIRRATRKNPVLGFLLDMVLQPEGTGYMASEMPFTIYYDDAMLANAEALSIKGLDEAQAHQRIMEIYNYMTSFSSPDELKQTGFYLDYETKYALSEYIWDAYKSLGDQWVELGSTGMLSYDVLGDGNWEEGKRQYYRLKQSVDNQKDMLQDFYYKWIKNSYLSDSMVVYRRYNTTYARDDNGEIYATGIRPQGVLPFLTAPGTATEPEGTAGYENDFMSISAVTGKPMTQRALVPYEVDQEWPDFEYFSEDHNGNGYSATWGNLYKSGSTGTTSGSGTPSSSHYRSGGGGGGGGSSSPNIYSRATTPNAGNASVVRRTSRQRPQMEYLRPNFETKGSREAYKRSDI